MSGLIGRKVGMTSIYDEKGRNIACTLIEAGPNVVTQIRTLETDGYEAVQVGYEEKKESRTTNALTGHFKKAGTTPKRKLVEFDVYDNEVALGAEITVADVFAEGDFVDVVGTSKGKGFQGVVKRHGFGGVGQSTHGQHNRLRAPGSIGAASYPARVFKGIRMAGRTGGDRVTVTNLKVLKVYADKNLILVSGCVPGAKNSYVTIQK